MLNFICLGSGSSGNSYFLFSENFGILIDAGIGIRTLKKHFRNYGLSLEQISAILITHDHADHIKAVGNLANEYTIPVYATPTVHEGINRNYCITTKIRKENIRYIEKGEEITLDAFRITAFEVPHDSSDNVGYSLVYKDTHFCLITDAGHVTDEMKIQIQKSDYLVLESNHDEDMLMMGPYPAHLKKRIRGEKGHLSNKEAAQALAENMSETLKHVWLCHLSEENNHPELARKTMDSILRTYGLLVDKDIKLDVLKRRIPSDIYSLQ
ncbi:MAG: MBL fold metallo-hydrolase [Clostridium sp.]|nr:MBL fold metallo-hydrolase [Clostridium sp.]